MRIYNSGNTSKIFSDLKQNKKKSTKKKYKSIDSLQKDFIPAKVSNEKSRGKKKTTTTTKTQKKRISSKNIEFLKRIGLKVKQN